MTASYCTIAELKLQDHLNITDADSDSSLGDIIDAVSRWIDLYCGREFYPTTETRYFTSWYNDVCFVDDISTTTGLAIYTDASGDGVYEDTWTTSAYYLRPYNPKNSQPCYAIERRIGGNFIFPLVPHGVKITATWGFTAVPDQVEQACILQSERLLALICSNALHGRSLGGPLVDSAGLDGGGAVGSRLRIAVCAPVCSYRGGAIGAGGIRSAHEVPIECARLHLGGAIRYLRIEAFVDGYCRYALVIARNALAQLIDLGLREIAARPMLTGGGQVARERSLAAQCRRLLLECRYLIECCGSLVSHGCEMEPTSRGPPLQVIR